MVMIKGDETGKTKGWELQVMVMTVVMRVKHIGDDDSGDEKWWWDLKQREEDHRNGDEGGSDTGKWWEKSQHGGDDDGGDAKWWWTGQTADTPLAKDTQ